MNFKTQAADIKNDRIAILLPPLLSTALNLKEKHPTTERCGCQKPNRFTSSKCVGFRTLQHVGALKLLD